MPLQEKIALLRQTLRLDREKFLLVPDELFKLIFSLHPNNKFVDNYGFVNYQQLEWYGDAVLELIVTRYLFQYRGKYRSQFMDIMRKRIVSNKQLAIMFSKFPTISSQEFLGYTMNVNTTVEAVERAQTKRLADIVEAIIGILYYSLSQERIDAITLIMNWFVEIFQIDQFMQDKIKEYTISCNYKEPGIRDIKLIDMPTFLSSHIPSHSTLF